MVVFLSEWVMFLKAKLEYRVRLDKLSQLMLLIKSCCWCFVVMLLVFFGFVLLVFDGWPKITWNLDWSAIGALATIVTGGIAAWIAVIQNRNSKFIRKQKRNVVIEDIQKQTEEIDLRLRKVARLANSFSSKSRGLGVNFLGLHGNAGGGEYNPNKEYDDFVNYCSGGEWVGIYLSNEYRECLSKKERLLVDGVNKEMKDFRSLTGCSMYDVFIMDFHNSSSKKKEISRINVAIRKLEEAIKFSESVDGMYELTGASREGDIGLNEALENMKGYKAKSDPKKSSSSH